MRKRSEPDDKFLNFFFERAEEGLGTASGSFIRTPQFEEDDRMVFDGEGATFSEGTA